MVTQSQDGTVQFKFYRPNAQQVTLAGDFNQWNRFSWPMVRSADGWWRIRIRLTPGSYQFRYCCDGEWFMDYAAFGLEHSVYGLNSVVLVHASTRLACEDLCGQNQETLEETPATAAAEDRRIQPQTSSVVRQMGVTAQEILATSS